MANLNIDITKEQENARNEIKKQGVDELISLNPDYPPKPYGQGDSIQCCGRVLCKLKRQ